MTAERQTLVVRDLEKQVALGRETISILRGVSFELHRGEVTGLAGLLGSGRTETARLLFGVDRRDSGEIHLRGEPVALRSPREAIDKINATVNAALSDPGMLRRYAELGGKPIKGTPEDFGKVIKAETDKWAKVVIQSGAKAE